ALKAQQLSGITEADATHLDSLSRRYLGFLIYAFNDENGRFRNLMSYSRDWLKSAGSEDSHGRALWALGSTTSMSEKQSLVSLASTLFMKALPATETFQSPRAIAFTMLGIDAYLKVFGGDSKARRIYGVLAEKLYAQFNDHSSDDWPWLEDIVVYSNARLPHALILAGGTLGRDDLTELGLRNLNWLLELQ